MIICMSRETISSAARNVLVSIIGTTVALSAFAFNVSPAHAQLESLLSIPTGNTGCFGGVGGGIVLNFASAGKEVPVNDAVVRKEEFTQTSKECSGDALTALFGEALLKEIVREFVRWANNGFDGNPVFVQDLSRYLQSVGDRAASDFLRGSELSNLPDAYESAFRRIIATNYFTPDSERLRTTLTDSQLNAIQRNDPEGLGLQGFFALIDDNPLNKLFEAQEQFEQAVSSAVAEETKLLEFGDGFHSLKDCSLTQGINPDAPNPVSGINCVISTPGALIEKQLSEILNIPIERLELADEVNELISAAFNQLTSKLTGPGGLFGLSESKDSSGDSFVDNLTEDPEITERIRTTTLTVIAQQKDAEDAYRQLHVALVGILENTEDELIKVAECYDQKIAQGGLGGNSSTATQRANAARTTINDEVLPLLDGAIAEIAAADAVIVDINALDSEARSATTNNELNNILADLQLLEGVHNSISFTVAERNAQLIADEMETISNQAKSDQQTCAVFPGQQF